MFGRSTEKLLDLLREPLWQSLPTTTIRQEVIPAGGTKMLIDLEAKGGPLLEIVSRTADDLVIHTQRFNLAGLDEHIGKLIEMRDKLEKLK